MSFVQMYCILLLHYRSIFWAHIILYVKNVFTMVLMLPCKYLLNLSWKKRLKGVDLEEQSFFYWSSELLLVSGVVVCLLVCLLLVVVLDVTVPLKASLVVKTL